MNGHGRDEPQHGNVDHRQGKPPPSSHVISPEIAPLDDVNSVDMAHRGVGGNWEKHVTEERHGGAQLADGGLMVTPSETSRSSSSISMGKTRSKTPQPPKTLVVPQAAQQQEHYQELLQQGKLRPGSIIKRTKSSPKTEALKPSYKMRERENLGEFWVFIVHGKRIKLWEKECGRLLNQLSLVEWKVYVTRYPGHGRKLAHRAAQKGATLIGAVGGDGTLNEVVDGIMRANVVGEDGLPRAVVTVLPLGSANDFCKTMGWDPSSFEEGMWRIGHRGQTAVLDVGRVTCTGLDGPVTRYMINVASTGISGWGASHVGKYNWLGKKLKYRVLGFFCTLLMKARTCMIAFDGGDWEKFKGVSMACCCNGTYFGSSLPIAPMANPFDGLGDIVVLKGSRSVITTMRFWSKIGNGLHCNMKACHMRKARTVDIRLADQEWTFDSKPAPLPEKRNSSGVHIEDSNPSAVDADAASTHSEFAEQRSMSQSTMTSHPMGSCASLETCDYNSDAESLREGERASFSGKKKKRMESFGQFAVEVDGEAIGKLPARFEIIPQAIKFRV